MSSSVRIFSQMYESYYGFKEKPFKLSPDPRFFFASAHHKRALAYLQYGLDQGEGFIVITGPIGTGKTTIARYLLEQLGNEDIVAAQLVTTKLSPEELLALVVAEFKISVKGNSKADLLQAIEGFLIHLNSQGKRALLIVDEAQNLPSETLEELRMLSNFQRDNSPLMQSFLLGQEELKPIIQAVNMEQFRQRIIASAHLSALTKEEVKAYINHRLHQAGDKDIQLFCDQSFDLIHQKTLGVPRKINIFIDRLLLFGFLEEMNSIDVNAINEVAEEMTIELTGSLHKPAMAEQQLSQQPDDTAAHRQKIDSVIADLSAYLDITISRKLNTLRHLDQAIKKQNHLHKKMTRKK